MSATSFTTRIDSDLKTRLERLARLEERSASYLAVQAIKALVEEREATEELARVGLELAKRDISVSEQAVTDWLQADAETPFPAPEPGGH